MNVIVSVLFHRRVEGGDDVELHQAEMAAIPRIGDMVCIPGHPNGRVEDVEWHLTRVRSPIAIVYLKPA